MDAWQQVDEIWRAHSKMWCVRDDLQVTARGPDRSVSLQIGESPKLKPAGAPREPHAVTTRNVSTMRELALAIWAACDSVEASNPEWASHAASLRPVESFLEER